jgi:hypothetical protein
MPASDLQLCRLGVDLGLHDLQPAIFQPLDDGWPTQKVSHTQRSLVNSARQVAEMLRVCLVREVLCGAITVASQKNQPYSVENRQLQHILFLVTQYRSGRPHYVVPLAGIANQLRGINPSVHTNDQSY